MKNSPATLGLILAASCLAMPVAPARTLYVSPDGKSGATGSATQPILTIQEGLNAAQAGDTVLVRKGVYHEYVSFKNGGTEGNPITLEGEPGAMLDGDYQLPLRWEPAPDIAPGVYRAKVAKPIFTVTVDGKIIMMVRESITQPGKAEKGPEWEWPKLFKGGAGDLGWAGVKALTMYRAKEKDLLIRFEGDLDPNKLNMTVGSKNKDDALIKVDGVNDCVIRGLSFRNAAAGIRATNSARTLIEKCVMGPIDFCILLHEGASKSIVRYNELSWYPYAGSDPYLPGAWDTWRANKRAGWLDRYGVEIRGTIGGVEVHDNYIHDAWDGISARPTKPGQDMDLNIHHNRIDLLCDDGLETAGAQENGQWHHNVVSRCIVGVRIKAPTNGPLYIYRNLFFGNKEGIRNFGEHELKPAVVYVYHNTSVGNAAVTLNKVFGIGNPNYHFYNNLYWCTHWVLNTPQGQSVNPNWTGDYNVYIRNGDSKQWEPGRELASKLGIDVHSTWATETQGFTLPPQLDVTLKEGNIACGKGTDLSRLLDKPLPGCEPGYFTGKAPDAGALSLGEPMPVVPRKDNRAVTSTLNRKGD